MDRAALALAATLVAAVRTALAFGVQAEYRNATDAALRTTATLARTLGSEVFGRLRKVETILRFGGTLYLRDARRFVVADWIGIDPGPGPGIVHAAVVGLDGRVITNLDGVPPRPIELADQPFIAIILADPTTDRPGISPRLGARVTGQQTINIARPLLDRCGQPSPSPRMPRRRTSGMDRCVTKPLQTARLRQAIEAEAA